METPAAAGVQRATARRAALNESERKMKVVSLIFNSPLSILNYNYSLG